MADPTPQTNARLAAIFLSLADQLASQGANPYRIRAYRRAAAALGELGEAVEAVAAREALQQIPGIGRELSAKIQEFVTTGTIQAYEALQTSLPEEVAAWSTLPGLSRPLVHHLYFGLGVRTLEDLESLVRSHMLRTLPGFSAPEEPLLDSIRRRREETSRQ